MGIVIKLPIYFKGPIISIFLPIQIIVSISIPIQTLKSMRAGRIPSIYLAQGKYLENINSINHLYLSSCVGHLNICFLIFVITL